MIGNAVISEDERYRYALTREWDNKLPIVLFVGLNPSTADETVDDPTIRRCIRFAERWGCGIMAMVNLFAYRTTDPHNLRNVYHTIGPENNYWITKLAMKADVLVAAWGANRIAQQNGRDRFVTKMLGNNLFCLGVTKDGFPRHPLYVRVDQELIPFGVSA